MGTVSLEILKNYIQSEGGIVTSQQIVKHFQPFLKDPANRDRNKELFKSYLSTLTDYRHEEGSNVRILELKKAYQLDGNIRSAPANENTPRNDKSGLRDQLQPMREAQISQRLLYREKSRDSREMSRDSKERSRDSREMSRDSREMSRDSREMSRDSREMSRDNTVGNERQQKRVTHKAVAPKQFGRDDSSEITLSCNVELDDGHSDPMSRDHMSTREASRDIITHRTGHHSPRVSQMSAAARRSPMAERHRSQTTTGYTGSHVTTGGHVTVDQSPSRSRSRTTAGVTGRDGIDVEDNISGELTQERSVASPATNAGQPVIRRASINAINMFNRTAQQKKPIKIEDPVSEEDKDLSSSKADTLESTDHTEELREEMESGCSNVPLDQNEKEWIIKSALGDCDTISRLLLTDRNLVTYRDFVSGYTGLHWSCKLARIDMARVLIEAGSDVNARSHSGQTPLHLAAQTGKGEVIDLLLRCGADKEVRDHKGRKPGQYLPKTTAPETTSLLTLPQPPLNLQTNPALRKFSKALSLGDINDNSPKRGQTMHQAWKKYKQSFVGKKKRGETLKIETTKRESVTNRVDPKEKCRAQTMPTSKPTAVYL